MNAKEEAKKLLDSWNQTLLDNLIDNSFEPNPDFNAHETIKALIETPINDKKLVKEICEQGSDFFFISRIRIYDFCSEELKNDRETILDILTAYGDNLALLNPKLQDDDEIVAVAVNSSDALKYASQRLRDDDIIVYISLQNDPETIEFASERFRNNRTLSLQLLKKHNYIFDKMSVKFRNDPTFISEYWDELKNKYSNKASILDAFIPRILNNIGDDIKPYFTELNLSQASNELLHDFETYLNTATLDKELNQGEVSHKKNKRPKL
jgi:hypothetical protein